MDSTWDYIHCPDSDFVMCQYILLSRNDGLAGIGKQESSSWISHRCHTAVTEAMHSMTDVCTEGDCHCTSHRKVKLLFETYQLKRLNLLQLLNCGQLCRQLFYCR